MESENKNIDRLILEIESVKSTLAELSAENGELWAVVNDMLKREADKLDAVDEVQNKLIALMREKAVSNQYFTNMHQRVMRLLYNSGFIEERLGKIEVSVFRRLPTALRQMRGILGEPVLPTKTEKFDRRS